MAKKKTKRSPSRKQGAGTRSKTKSAKSVSPAPVASEGRLGILAGAGDLPWLAVRAAIRRGETDVRAFCFTDDPPPPDLTDHYERIILTKFYSSTLRAFRKAGVKRMLLLGKSTRDILYNKPRFDARTLLLLARMVSQSDYAIFSFLADVVEKEGFEIIPQDEYLSELFLLEGRYGRKLDKKQLADVSFGLDQAREINRLDIGQTVVVGNQAVLAVEAAEGTDRCIRRGGELFRNKGAIVCKLAKENHDRRFDIPATGASTLESMAASGCRVLAFDAAHTFVIDPLAFLEEAGRKGITVVAVNPALEQQDTQYLKRINSRTAKYTK
ncbi:MAG: UDP-2,3-diacylglucosamine diphosphatase LpxI [bacterium]|nr:UDP-2,3-diacylglucosamine diphosphatase LpxI [bacterium]